MSRVLWFAYRNSEKEKDVEVIKPYVTQIIIEYIFDRNIIRKYNIRTFAIETGQRMLGKHYRAPTVG